MIEHEPWWEEVVGDLVEILLELGEAGCARRTLDFYCDRDRSGRWQIGTAVELRCRALLGAAGGDHQGALRCLDAALAAAVDDDPWSVVTGRILLARGSLLRVLERTWEARADLKRALAIFTRHGAGGWRAAALRALVGTVTADADPWAVDERRPIVSVLTGRHWTDHEIAARLQLSVLAVQRELRGGPPPAVLPAAESL